MFFALNQLGFECKAIDKNPPEIPYQDNDFSSIDFTQDRFPYPNDYFDMVLSKSVLEHIYDPTIYLEEIFRTLKPNGLFIVLVPDWVSQHLVFYEDPTHVHPYLKSGLVNLLKL